MMMNRKAFTLVEVIIAVAVIAILLSIGLPQYAKTRFSSRKTVCINNLKQIDAAIDQWAIEHNISDGTMPTDDVYNYIKNTARLTCPSGGTYALHEVGSKPQVTCSLEEGEGHKLAE
ncbi:MAG: prepilin-type N-terminal cleavage/methylation domain-containing protein [Candidatus Omnitrophota bacterium]